MKKIYVPAVMVLAVACGGGGDVTPPVKTLSDITSMNVGEVRLLNPTDIPNGINLQASTSARDYLIVVANTSAQHDVPANFVVKADKSTTGVFSLEAAADLAAQSGIQLNQAPLTRTPQEVFESRVRAFERAKLSLRSRSSVLGATGISARRSAQVATASVPVVGQVVNINVPNGNPAPGKDLCSDFFPTQAVVASVSNKAILMVDTLDGPPAALFTQQQMDSITAEFDNVTYPTDAAYFNTPTDIDGNGRIIMLFTGEINKLTPPNQPAGAGFIGGFFFAGDFFPTAGATAGDHCAESNLAEVFYLLSPDPTGTKFGNVRSASSVRQGTRGTIAHEFQHMINAGNRLQNPQVQAFEATWLDEALAHFAEDAVGRQVTGLTDLQTFAASNLPPCGNGCQQANDFNAFFFQNLARLTYWMDKPDTYSPMSILADTSLATRGAAWAIVRYGADNYSAGLPRAFTKALVAGPDTGFRNFNAVTKVPLDTVVKGWLVSMYADHLGITGLDAKYQYRSYNFRSVMPAVARSVLSQSVATYPLRVQSIGSGSDNISAKNISGTGSFFRLTVAAGAGAKNVKVLDTSGNNASFSGEHVYVLRVQ